MTARCANLYDSDIILRSYPEDDPTLMYITRHGELYVSESFWRTGGWLPKHLAPHLLKIHEMFEASLDRFPDLKHIEVNLEVQGWESQRSKIAMRYESNIGVLAIASSSIVSWPQPAPWVSLISRPPRSLS